MNKNVVIFINEIIKREGGYVLDPDDPGGETKYGISKRAYPKEDIKNLTVSHASEIYLTDYYLASGCAKLPESIQEIFLDIAVHQGVAGAIRVLQQAVGVTVDGKIGPMTLRAANDLRPDRLRAYRVLSLAKKVISNPKLEKFWAGWYQRATTV